MIEREGGGESGGKGGMRSVGRVGVVEKAGGEGTHDESACVVVDEVVGER